MSARRRARGLRAALLQVGESLALSSAAINVALRVSEITTAITSRATVNELTAE